jgi:hypothetical protein
MESAFVCDCWSINTILLCVIGTAGSTAQVIQADAWDGKIFEERAFYKLLSFFLLFSVKLKFISADLVHIMTINVRQSKHVMQQSGSFKGPCEFGIA